MSSNLQIQRICQHCDKEFTARTTVTQYCGDNCAKRAYKVRQRAVKVEQSNKQTQAVKLKPITDIKAKEFLTIKDTATLLNCSRQTVYNLIGKGILQAVNLSERKTLIKRSGIDKLFELKSLKTSDFKPLQDTFNPDDCYTISEVQKRYNVSEKTLHELIKRNAIPKHKKGRFAYVPKQIIDNLLRP
jgi:excisionase family DNA binding protein